MVQPVKKAEFRALARTIGGADRRSAAECVVRRLIALPEIERARTLALYSAIGDEVEVEAVGKGVRARGGRTVYPRQTESGLVMAVSDGGSSLQPASHGILEPSGDAALVRVGEVDVFVVPGLMFDRRCRRLGRGRGLYDRSLREARSDSTIIGVCYSDRVVQELPEDDWDVRMDLVVTESFVIESRDPGEGT